MSKIILTAEISYSKINILITNEFKINYENINF